jgi:hypothetical protein
MALVVRGVVGAPVLCGGNAVSRPRPGLTKAWSRRLPASAALPLPGAAQARRSIPHEAKPMEFHRWLTHF